MRITATRRDAYDLLHEGSLVLADIERYGIRIDVSHCKKATKRIDKDTLELEKQAKNTKDWRVWKRTFGADASLTNKDQLRVVLYDKLGHTPLTTTEKTGRGQVNIENLKAIKSDLTTILMRMGKLKTARDHLQGILSEVVDGLIHPSFNLASAVTYRSSCNSPNFQNMPIRDPEQGELVRRAIIPREGCHIGESDFKGIEVGVSACYHKDPLMLDYLHDKTKDMHRDNACMCFRLGPDQVDKKTRYCGKNGFTFPEFYGSYFEQIAPAMWRMIAEHNLATADKKIPLYDWLAGKGIDCEQDFTAHIKNVEDIFWHKRFKVYDAWKRKHYEAFLKRGFFDTLTGFRCWGPMGRNDSSNYPVQGSAFHCLLWTLIQAHKRMHKLKMRSHFIGQIHDSAVCNIAKYEAADVFGLIADIVENDLPKHWPWIIVPLETENEIAPLNESWNNKKEWKETE